MATIKKRLWSSQSELKAAKAEGRAPVKDREAWVVRYADQAGKWRLKHFDKKADADSWLTDAKGQVKAGTHTADSASPTLEAACEAWLKRGEIELEPSSMRHRRVYVYHHILRSIDGKTKLSRITPAQLEAFRDELLGKVSPAMARKVIIALRAILRQAKAVHLASADLKVKGGGRHQKPLKVGVDIPTADEIKAVAIDFTGDPKARALVCLAAFAGLRASELRGLAWSHIDLDKPEVTIEGRADEFGVIGSPKSAAGHRKVSLNATTVKALRDWRIKQRPIVTKDDGGNEIKRPRKLVFGTATDRPDGLANIRRRVFHPAMVKAGVVIDGQPKYTGLHCLRHFAVSSWLKTCGGDFKAVQTRAGHATLALTLDTYGHLLDSNDGDQIAAAEKLVLG